MGGREGEDPRTIGILSLTLYIPFLVTVSMKWKGIQWVPWVPQDGQETFH
jgi:hypothetical protein